MVKCAICGLQKYFIKLCKISMYHEPYEPKTMEVCFRCLSKIGFKMGHEGD